VPEGEWDEVTIQLESVFGLGETHGCEYRRPSPRSLASDCESPPTLLRHAAQGPGSCNQPGKDAAATARYGTRGHNPISLLRPLGRVQKFGSCSGLRLPIH
jgi:hypothetical protein